MLNKVYHHIGYVNKCVVLGIFPCQTFEEMLNKQILSCCLFSCGSQMMLKCGMQSTAKYVINVTSSVIYYCTDPQQHGMYLFCVIKKDVLLMVMSSMQLYFPPLKCVHYSAYHINLI